MVLNTEYFKRKVYRIFVTLLAASLVSALGLNIAEAKSKKGAAAFYEGKNIVLIVPYKPGGGYDLYCRLLAPYLSKYTGARIIVKNVIGAGGIVGMNDVYTAAPNGLTIGMVDGISMACLEIAKAEGIRYEVAKFGWIGRVTTNLRVLALRKDFPYKTWQQFVSSKSPLKLGTAGVGTSAYVDSVVTAGALNIKAEVVPGYLGSKVIELGMLRGEIDGQWGSYTSRMAMDKAGKQFIILQGGERRHADLPDVPSLLEVATTEKGKSILTTLSKMHEVGRCFDVTPGIPKERLAFLREAFSKAMHDPDLLKAADKARMDLDYLGGEEVATTIIKATKIQDEEIKRLFIKAINGES